ncbi:MAG: hypothetical protein LBS96_01600 [Oscillospiraceae bacterium]|jgi:hypothetical protein|nr:hypothetical protein [Oscillospiraceae bacterium]
MKQTIRKILATALALTLALTLGSMAVSAASAAKITIGTTEYATLTEAFAAAASGDTVTVSGKVTTAPAAIPSGVTLEGKDGAVIAIDPTKLGDGNEVLRIGADGAIKNVTVSGGLKTLFAIRIFGAASGVVVLEDVVAKSALRGGVNILNVNGSTVTLKNVAANANGQAGFYFDADPAAEGITFENSATAQNRRTGVIIRNAFGNVTGLDLSGVKCGEGSFAIEERTASAEPFNTITLVAPPAGISTAKALRYLVEEEYTHFRFGATIPVTLGSSASIKTNRYGFETELYYTLASTAEADVRDGETITPGNFFSLSFGKVLVAFAWLGELISTSVRFLVAAL